MLAARWLIVALGAFVLCGQPGFAQRLSNWRLFKVSDGLAESSVSSVAVGQRTNVWLWHNESDRISSFDGYRIKHSKAPTSGNSRVYEGRIGQLWAPYSLGLQEFKNGSWTAYPIPEIQKEYQTSVIRNVRPLSLIPLRHGQVLFLVSDQLIQFSSEAASSEQTASVLPVNQTELGKFTDMILARDGTIWITGQKGFAISTNFMRSAESPKWEQHLPPPELQLFDLQQPQADDEGGIVVVGESGVLRRRVAIYFDGNQWFVLPAGKDNFRQAWRGSDGSFWATSINALFYRAPEGGEFVESSEVTAGRYFDVATDNNGAFWLATSEGLIRYAPPLWRTPSDFGSFHAPISSVWEDPGGNLCFATTTALVLSKDNRRKTFFFPETVEPKFPQMEFIFTLRDESIVFEANERLLQFQPGNEVFTVVSHPSGDTIKPIGMMRDGSVCVQVLQKDSSSSDLRLEVFNGQRFQAFPETQPPFGAGADALFVFTAANGDLWFSASDGLSLYRDKEWKTFSAVDGNAPDAALCILEISPGKVWCGTRNQIWEFDGGDWTSIQSGFERVNSMTRGRDGSIWVGTSGGLFRYHEGTWTVSSTDEGLPASVVTKVYEDRRGQLWAGTARGLSRFHPEADPDPPDTLILPGSRPREDSIEVTFGGRDKWKYTPAENLLFSYRLDEQEWSPFRFERTVSFSDLSAGTHYFQVRAMDRNGNVDPEPERREYEIPLPWFKETRLVLISIAGLTGVVFFAALAVNRHRRLIRSHAEVEKMVALRTRQLEEANEQLLHSQKMTALGTLSAGIAHDFNNILSIIKGSAQIIETNLDDQQKVQTRLDRIKTVVDQGSGIVRAMLGFSRPSEKKLAPSQINRVVEETIKLLGDRFLREVEVKLEPDKTLPEVVIAPDFIQQILLNFIFNAADALNGSGQIILRTGAMQKMPDHVILPPAKADSHIYICVRDAGCGIAPEILPRIFEPFFTTKAFSSRRGTGLGLSMVYQMAKDTGCGLAVESAPGKGSTFTLIIPVNPVPVA